MDCVEHDLPACALAVANHIALVMNKNDQNVYFCTGTEQSDHSTEHTCIGVISFSSAMPKRYISTGFIIINQSKSFYRTATTVMRRRNATLGLWESTCADQSIGKYVLFLKSNAQCFCCTFILQGSKIVHVRSYLRV